MTVLQRFSDRMLAMFVPRTVAAAVSTFTQYCGCYRVGPIAHYTFFKTCWWNDQPGGPYTCNDICYYEPILC
jgi:hypothetical protein